MSKRFTDTTKWDHAWFSDLSIIQKILWVYLCDSCDSVGVWKVNFKLASFLIGAEVTQKDLDAIGDSRVVKIAADKVWLPGFIKFQYKTLNPKNHAHRGMMRSLVNTTEGLPLTGESEELINNFKQLLNDPQPTPKGESGDSTGKGNGKGNGKVKVLKGGMGEKYSDEFEAFWSVYPRKAEKTEAFESFKKNVNPEEQSDIMKSAANFNAVMASEKREIKHIKLGATFLNKRRWRDYIDIDLSLIKTKNYENERETDHDDELKKMWGA